MVNGLQILQRNSNINVLLGSKYASVACKEQRKKTFYMKNVKILWHLFMNVVQLSQGYRVTKRR